MTCKTVDFVSKRQIKVKGNLRVQVVDSETGRVKRDNGWQPNLLLNQGLSAPTFRSWADCFTYAVCGTGTTPTQEDSGATQATQSGNAVTSSGGGFSFVSGDVGNIIKWDSGEEAIITAYIGASSVTVDPSASVSGDEFTLYRANQTGMATETKRTTVNLAGAGNCETVYTAASGLMKLRRTFDFTTEVGPITYTEVGLSHTNTVAANLFARILLAVPLNLVAGDQLRVIYELQLTLTPFAPRAITPTITGWTGVSGDEMCEAFSLSQVNSAGGSVNENYFLNEPTGSARAFLSNSTTALQANPSTGAVINRNGTTYATKITSNVTTGIGTLALTVTRSVTFTTSEGNMTGIRSIAIAFNTFATDHAISHAFLMDNPQDKTNTFSLALSWKLVWSRTLS